MRNPSVQYTQADCLTTWNSRDSLRETRLCAWLHKSFRSLNDAPAPALIYTSIDRCKKVLCFYSCLIYVY